MYSRHVCYSASVSWVGARDSSFRSFVTSEVTGDGGLVGQDGTLSDG